MMDRRNEHHDENVQRSPEKELAISIFLYTLASLILAKRSETIPLGQMCLECVFLGVTQYLREKTAKGSSIIMIGGCACWYLNSVIQNKWCLLAMLGGLQLVGDMRFYTCYLMSLLTVIHAGSALHPFPNTFSLVCLIIGVAVMYWKHTPNVVLEDIVLLLPLVLVNLPYVVFADETKCWVLFSLGCGLSWIVAKETLIWRYF